MFNFHHLAWYECPTNQCVFLWYEYPTNQQETGNLKLRLAPPSIIHAVMEREWEEKTQRAHSKYLEKLGQKG